MMSCQNTLGFYMQTEEIADALIAYFERVEEGRCKTCQTQEQLAKITEDSDVPPGLGLMYLRWIKE